MAGSLALGGNQQAKTVKTNSMTVEGHLLKWYNVTIQISNISAITAWEIQPGPSLIAVLILMLGGALILAGILAMVMQEITGFWAIVAGVVLLYISMMIKKPKSKTALNIYLNSGNVYSILFDDDAFMRKVLNTFSEIFRDDAVSGTYTFNIKDCTIDHSKNVNQNINYGTQGTGIHD